MNNYSAVLLFAVTTSLISAATLIPDSEIRDLLVRRIDVDRQSVGIVVGVVGPERRGIIAYGALDKGDPRPLNGDTLFEIGSVSKVFTSLLLADMAQDNEVALTDPVRKYLPASVTMPKRGALEITLEDLATHTSGLPRLPTNLSPKNPTNPYADYTVEQLYQFLSAYKLTRDIGSQYEYSNLGGGLLGHVLARRAGMTYEALLSSRVCEPLGLNSTVITLTPEMKQRFAVGHDAELKAVPYWDLPTLAGAGAIRSTANDLLTFVAANLGYQKSPLAQAMAAMLKVRRPTGTPGLDIALGWHVFTRDGDEIVWHNGGTGGFRSFIGYSPKSRFGVVVLSNTETPEGVDDIGRRLLDPGAQLTTQVHLDSKTLDGYTGNYQLFPKTFLTVTRDGEHLFAQLTGQGKAEILPRNNRDFFYKVVDAQITFDPDAQGRATSLTLHQGGKDLPAKRKEGALPPPKEHNEVHVDPKLFDGYIGNYQLAPTFIIAITREGDHLFAQATAQPKFEIYPEGDREYFLKVVDAQITFEVNAAGQVTALVLHQGGMDQRAKKI